MEVIDAMEKNSKGRRMGLKDTIISIVVNKVYPEKVFLFKI